MKSLHGILCEFILAEVYSKEQKGFMNLSMSWGLVDGYYINFSLEKQNTA
ncbi:hypothetical protein [Clostridium lacusfryxellense]|nr:hypothetical protein [Clostridium lacusfryxellense]MBU3112591.1 hypothetical protein [Clostridium lacusfryxellense]